MLQVFRRAIKESLFTNVDRDRFNDRLVMSALRNGPISNGKYLMLGEKFYEKKLGYCLTNMYGNTEHIYDMGNWFYFSYLSGFMSEELFKERIMWLSATMQLLTLHGVEYTPKDRL